MMCKSPLCTSLGWGRPGRQPQRRGQHQDRGVGRGRTTSTRRVGKRSHPGGAGEVLFLGSAEEGAFHPSSSRQTATLDRASRLGGAWAPCAQPSICKASNKISPWRHREAYPQTRAWLRSPPRAWEQLCPSGMKRAKRLHPGIHH